MKLCTFTGVVYKALLASLVCCATGVSRSRVPFSAVLPFSLSPVAVNPLCN